MATSKRQTFQDILANGIDIPNTTEPIKIDKFFIPRIQRSYAQGRKSEGEVRNNILKDIFSCLCDDKENVLELSFLFGSKQPSASGGSGFELLDGQQRITTLFLLHWYLWMKEHNQDEPIPDYLKKFTYETRDTSTHFVHKIVDIPLNLEEEKPSKIIKERKWFTPIFNCDATVCSMLTMLDTIDEKYKESRQNNLYDRLNRLQFYVLYLDDFELNDELYIKMNSRGLDLTPFENFKASLVRYMKDKGGDFVKDVEYMTANGTVTKMPYYLRFSTKMDTIWSDIFWSMPTLPSGDVTTEITIDNLGKDKKFFRFIIRYFFSKLVLYYKDKDYMDLENFFYNKKIQEEGRLIHAESQYAMETRLVGWENYQKVIEMLAYEGINKLEKVLDTFKQYYCSIIKNIIKDNPYKTWDWDVSSENITFQNRVVFATLIEFIEMIPDGKDFMDSTIQKNLKKLLRVMWNVIENTQIDKIDNAISVIRAMSETIHLPGAVDIDFYDSISKYQINNRNNQLDEEVAKARKIVLNYNTDINWENSFITAEKHPFFKGMLRFFYEDSISTSKEFDDRYKVTGNLFDASGITQHYRNNHVLIRALIGKINIWSGEDGLRKKSITENAENQGYLKILLRTKGAHELFCGFFNSNFTDIDNYLCDVIRNASWSDHSDIRLNRVFNRLVNDDPISGGSRSIELLNKMFDIEKSRNKQFYIDDTYGVVMALIPHNERIVLDTERHLIIEDLTRKDGFYFTNTDQHDSMNTDLRDVWGLEVSLKKEVKDSKCNNVTIVVEFGANKIVSFYIEVKNTDVSSIQNNLVTQANNRYQYKLNPQIKYDSASDYPIIKAKIDEIENEIKGL